MQKVLNEGDVTPTKIVSLSFSKPCMFYCRNNGKMCRRYLLFNSLHTTCRDRLGTWRVELYTFSTFFSKFKSFYKSRGELNPDYDSVQIRCRFKLILVYLFLALDGQHSLNLSYETRWRCRIFVFGMITTMI